MLAVLAVALLRVFWTWAVRLRQKERWFITQFLLLKATSLLLLLPPDSTVALIRTVFLQCDQYVSLLSSPSKLFWHSVVFQAQSWLWVWEVFLWGRHALVKKWVPWSWTVSVHGEISDGGRENVDGGHWGWGSWRQRSQVWLTFLNKGLADPDFASLPTLGFAVPQPFVLESSAVSVS